MWIELQCEEQGCIAAARGDTWDCNVKVVSYGEDDQDLVPIRDGDPADCHGSLACPECGVEGVRI